jgi:hypothetical protein
MYARNTSASSCDFGLMGPMVDRTAPPGKTSIKIEPGASPDFQSRVTGRSSAVARRCATGTLTCRRAPDSMSDKCPCDRRTFFASAIWERPSASRCRLILAPIEPRHTPLFYFDRNIMSRGRVRGTHRAGEQRNNVGEVLCRLSTHALEANWERCSHLTELRLGCPPFCSSSSSCY